MYLNVRLELYCHAKILGPLHNIVICKMYELCLETLKLREAGTHTCTNLKLHTYTMHFLQRTRISYSADRQFDLLQNTRH